MEFKRLLHQRTANLKYTVGFMKQTFVSELINIYLFSLKAFNFLIPLIKAQEYYLLQVVAAKSKMKIINMINTCTLGLKILSNFEGVNIMGTLSVPIMFTPSKSM